MNPTEANEMKPLTHKEAVRRIVNWLRGSRGCGVVLAELSTQNTETPDAIGFHGIGGSILVECKISRADFLADRNKVFRRDEELGMGDLRYFATPPRLLKAEDLPTNWGLLEIEPHRIREVVEAVDKTACKRAEVKMLTSVIRRLELSTAVFVREERTE